MREEQENCRNRVPTLCLTSPARKFPRSNLNQLWIFYECDIPNTNETQGQAGKNNKRSSWKLDFLNLENTKVR